MANLSLLKADVLVPSGAESMAAFEGRLAKLNTKAVKYGLSPVVAGEPERLRYVRRYERGSDGEVKNMYVVPLRKGEALKEGEELLHLNRIALEYPIISLGPWKVLGKIEPLGEGRITFAATEVETELQQLAAYRASEPCCEHCHTKRRRKETYVVRHAETGETKQIGSTCLQDFTGIDPAKVLFLAQMYAAVGAIDDDYEHFIGGVAGDHGVRPVDYLRDVLFVAEWEGGFVSSARAKEEFLNPTYRLAKELVGNVIGKGEFADRYRESRARLLASAQRVIDWWRDFEPTSEFERTAQQVVTAESVPFENKFLAIAAASIPARERALKKALTQEAIAAHPSEHVGTEGEKMQQAMRLTGCHAFDSAYGRAYFVNFVDAAGNKYSWKTASPPDEVFDGEATAKWFDGRFKIKDHDEYRGEKITTITRVKFDGWIPAPVATDCVRGAADAAAPNAVRLLVVDVPVVTQAFDSMGWRQQAELLLRDVAGKLRDPDHDVFEPITVFDADGNMVGSVSFPQAAPARPGDGHLQVVLEPGAREAWVDAMEGAAKYVAKFSQASEPGITVSRDGHDRIVGGVHWESLLAYEAAYASSVEANLYTP